MIPNLTIDRLIELVQAHPDKPVTEALETWRQEYLKALEEHHERAKQAAKDNPTRYGLARYETKYEADGGVYREVARPVEYVAVNEQDIPEFAKSHGLKLEHVWQVLRGIRLGEGSWRAWETPAWSASKYYVDRTAERETRLLLEQEDKETAEWHQKRTEAAKQPAKPLPMFPKFSLFRKGAN